MSSSELIYPVGLVVAGKRCLVVGGGHVAGRKVRSLLTCKANVTMVAPEAHEALGLLSSDGTIAAIEDNPLDVQLRPYEPGEAGDYMLAVTATGVPEVDRLVAEDARKAGVWVNSADDPANCTFLLPAVHRRGQVTITVSTSGSSPALATWLRGRIAEALGPGIEELASLLEEGQSASARSGLVDRDRRLGPAARRAPSRPRCRRPDRRSTPRDAICSLERQWHPEATRRAVTEPRMLALVSYAGHTAADTALQVAAY